jgi:sialate O-acetylesterase
MPLVDGFCNIQFVFAFMNRSFLLVSFLLFVAFIDNSIAQVRLPRLVRDSMVLQRDTRVRIWGWASAREKVSIQFNNKTYKVTTGPDRKWQVFLPPMPAGGPYTMHIKGSNQLELKDILIGDVWICSGQSNMVHQMILHRELYEQDIASANNGNIRHFWIPTMTDLQGPHDDLPTGYWKPATAQDVLQFSAVAYFFAKKIYDRYKVPIGLINASVGGTPIQAWTSEEGLASFPDINSLIQKNKDTAYTNGFARKALAANANRPASQDKGLTGSQTWFDVNYQPTGWRTINIPGYWEDQGVRDLDGVVWYRREIIVPASMVNVPAKLALGRIVDADMVYVNGKQVGNTGYQYPQRRYALAPGILQAGKNIIVVRVTNNSGKGGFVPDKPYYISAGQDTLDLKGTWQYKVGEVFIPQVGGGAGFSAQNSPTALYNSMLAPATPYTIKGFLWYQGEANTFNAAAYTALMPALINNWRKLWGQGELPFLYVQLPNFMDVQYLPSESQWAATREAQLKTLAVPNTGMAVAIDLGEWNDIHPDNKKDVGERLALWAQRIAYGDQHLVVSGPLFDTAIIDNNRIIIRFTHTGSGLITRDGEAPGSFAIAGADKKFVWAKVKIEGNQVVVWQEGITNPQYVRYAWADNPDHANLYNKEGLPASPFRTDR